MAKPGPAPIFNCHLADVILERLSGGESLRAICQTPGMPNRVTVLRWVANDVEGFAGLLDRLGRPQTMKPHHPLQMPDADFLRLRLDDPLGQGGGVTIPLACSRVTIYPFRHWHEIVGDKPRSCDEGFYTDRDGRHCRAARTAPPEQFEQQRKPQR
jgi:hypothetical protein